MIKYASDFSGIEAGVQALKNLGIPIEHVFSSELDKYARSSLLANSSPGKLYLNALDPKDLSHSVDLYLAGPPCQSFSLAGKRLGAADPRGQLFEAALSFIRSFQPKVFVLENVRGLLSSEYWTYVLETLRGFEDYFVEYRILNTKDFGIPQNRERVYIVGIKHSCLAAPFTWPSPIECIPLLDLVDYSDLRIDPLPSKNPKILDMINTSQAVFLNMGFRNWKPHSYRDFSPAVIANGSYWNLPMHRKASNRELLALQGFPTNFKQVVSDTQFRKQIGNSMSVNVLEALFRQVFLATNFS